MSRAITAKSDPETSRAYWTTNRGDTERAFLSARRHSRLVRILRIAVPASVAVAVVIITLITYFNPLRMLARLPINIDNLVVSGTKVTMEQPRLSGFTRDARAYELTADTAAQDMTKPDIVELRNIRAKVEMQDKTSMEMTAVTGIYDAKGETLKLDQDILLHSSTGYQGHLSEALVDIRKGNVVSERPVEVKLLQGTLNANKLDIVDSGDVIRFHGGVIMDMMLNQPPPQQKSDAQ
ncbi:MAG TPA: LPS export ABC transporter periplasmic protein LptC [Pseudolabrys sp.]|jgi:lipopolysaccharide export system protein LptC|nr:LPS export ABC transporter periplasmic protein LptC [Pseudolabrys sp.]